MRRHLLYLAITIVMGPVIAFAQSFPAPIFQNFIAAESQNDYQPQTTVNSIYRPQKDRVFKLNYIDLPLNELVIEDSHFADPDLRNQLLISKNGENYFRFFIHPESENLYADLIREYGFSGFYWASPTSSTRSVLAWDSQSPRKPLFLKLSLAQNQDGMGRIIPDWEVRRSVGITQLIQQTDPKIWEKNGSTIIPEFVGAYIKKNRKIGFYVDANQGVVYQHGLIARDSSFLYEHPDCDIVPLFSLFTKRGNNPPLIIQLWRKSNLNFTDFIAEYLFKPMIEKNRYMMLYQGIIPEIHGQNVLVAINKKTKQIQHIYHRDIGSMKVDLRLRMIRGLSIEPLRTPNAGFDFKLARAPETIEQVYLDYLNDWIFRLGYFKSIRQYIPEFNPEETKAILFDMIKADISATLEVKNKKSDHVIDLMNRYYEKHPIINWRALELPTNEEKLREFVQSQFAKGQALELPRSWSTNIKWQYGGRYLVTEYGVIFRRGDNSLILAYHASGDMKEIRVPKSYVQEVTLARRGARRIGFYSGTFDPPHLGHKNLVEKAIRELQLDQIYIVPNIDPAHKPNATSNAARNEMTKIMFQDIPKAIVADDKISSIVSGFGVGGLQYYLSDLYSSDQVFQIMGDDSYLRLKENAEIQFPKNYVIALATRSSSAEVQDSLLRGTPVVRLAPDQLQISSTLIRKQMMEAGHSPYLANTVSKYIELNELYRAPNLSQARQCRSLLLAH